MKKILLLTFIVMSQMIANSQHKISCHPTEEFAMFSKDEAFKAEHEEPVKFKYTGGGELITFTTDDGKEAKGFLIKSEQPTSNYLFVFHEWWGLNDYIKQQAETFQKDLRNINVLALDLYDGKVTDSREEAAKLMTTLDVKRGEAIINGAVKYAGADAKIFTVGWCLGGGWSLQASLLSNNQASGCIIYYGMPEDDTEKLKKLNADVLGIFAAKDEWISQEVVAEFDKNMQAAGKRADIVSFDADHAFANPSNPQFDKEATAKAYKYSIDFLKERLK